MMIDQNIILNKTSKVHHHLNRIRRKREISLEDFLMDLDRQEIILFNLQMAVQNCIDIAAHIISDDELGMAGSTSEMFYILQENAYLTFELAEKMVAAVGFRNIAVHEYGNIDLKLVFQMAKKDLDDLERFVKAILEKCGIT
jgi:uncharacterized protein YutE (UPF0331/DUF86 family)